MKTRIVGIAALGLMLASAGWAQSQKSSSKKKAAPAAESKPTAEAKKEPPAPAAKAAAKPDAAPAAGGGMQGPGRVTQVHTPTLPPLPEGAVQIERYAWRATDKDGKVWIYRRTPFGYSKYEADDQPAEEAITDLVAVDKGDSVEFQRKTPFGLSKWTKKKDELDANEAAALKRAAASSSKGAQE